MFSGSYLCLLGIVCFVVVVFLSYFVYLFLGEACRPSSFWKVFMVYMLCSFVFVFWWIFWEGGGDVVVICFRVGTRCLCLFLYYLLCVM